MSTRGFIGFVADGKTFIAYNHADSYPSALGADMLSWLRGADLGLSARQAAALRVVDARVGPTDADIAAFKEFYNPNVGGRHDQPDWYQLLRGAQGEPELILRAGVIEDASGFPSDSLFAEWGYVADFDTRSFEVYKGFQKEAHAEGRFASETPNANGYWPVRLIASWPLGSLPTDEQFHAKFDDGDEEEE